MYQIQQVSGNSKGKQYGEVFACLNYMLKLSIYDYSVINSLY